MLYLAAGIAAFTAIAYELLLASYTTFLMGASILQYSLVISLMMASMGIGSYITHRWQETAISAFVCVEILLSWLAAASIPLLYLSFASPIPPHAVLLVAVIGIGGIIGMEIPLINNALKSDSGLGNLLFFDYFGGFIGGIAFPVILLPQLGFFKLAAILSGCNSGLALLMCLCFFKETRRKWLFLSIASFCFSIAAFWFADDVRRWMELNLFQIFNVIYEP